MENEQAREANRIHCKETRDRRRERERRLYEVCIGTVGWGVPMTQDPTKNDDNIKAGKISRDHFEIEFPGRKQSTRGYRILFEFLALVLRDGEGRVQQEPLRRRQ